MFLFTNGELDRLGAGLALHVAAPVELALAPLFHSGEQDQHHFEECDDFDGFHDNSDDIHSGEQDQHYLEVCDKFDDALGHSNGNIDDVNDNISSGSTLNKSERLKKGIMDGVRMRW